MISETRGLGGSGSKMEAREDQFRLNLLNLLDKTAASESFDVERFRRVIFEYGSQGEDNQDAAERIAVVASATEHTLDFGFGLVRLNVLLSDIVWELESADVIPPCIVERYPEVTLQEWQAGLRFIVLLLTSFQRRSV